MWGCWYLCIRTENVLQGNSWGQDLPSVSAALKYIQSHGNENSVPWSHKLTLRASAILAVDHCS